MQRELAAREITARALGLAGCIGVDEEVCVIARDAEVVALERLRVLGPLRAQPCFEKARELLTRRLVGGCARVARVIYGQQAGAAAVVMVNNTTSLPPFTVPLQKLSAGHYYAPLYDIPYSGKWQMTVRVQLGQTDEAVLVSPFSVR